jgi:hypothetical protein
MAITCCRSFIPIADVRYSVESKKNWLEHLPFREAIINYGKKCLNNGEKVIKEEYFIEFLLSSVLTFTGLFLLAIVDRFYLHDHHNLNDHGILIFTVAMSALSGVSYSHFLF